jgi:RNA polymerase sigma-70 factor (ECF subfamily)
VYGVALRVTRDAHLAEDVAQEALVEVWRTAPRFATERGSARAWILTIAHRRAVDRVRSEQAHTDRLRDHGADHVDTGPDLASADAAVDKVYAEWEAARVAAGLNRLTPLQREALELAYYKGLTHREVAVELNVPLGTAKTRLRDAMLSLKNAWEVER